MVCATCMQFLTFRSLYYPGFIHKLSMNGSKFYLNFFFGLFLAHTTLREFYLSYFLIAEYTWHLISILLLYIFYSTKNFMIVLYAIYYMILLCNFSVHLKVTFIFPFSKEMCSHSGNT